MSTTDSVADPLGLSHFDGFTDVESEVRRGHQSQCQLARMERNVHSRVLSAEPADHLHVQLVVAQRHLIVLRRNQVDAHDTTLDRSQLERVRELRVVVRRRR